MLAYATLVKYLRYDTYRSAYYVEDPFEGPTDGLQFLHLEQGKVFAFWALAETVLGAGAQ